MVGSVRLRFLIGAGFLLLPGILVSATPASETWRMAPPPAWVSVVALPPCGGAVTSEIRGGIQSLVVDHQALVGEVTTHYCRRAWSPVSTAGIQSAREVRISFDPDYQRLIIHHVRVVREGHDVLSLSPEDVRVIQREEDLDEQIYSGELTALVFLKDLRPGDVVDYAYSIEGENPLLEGRFDDDLPLGLRAPVRHLRHILLLPEGRHLNVAAHNTAITPRVTNENGRQTYLWEARDVSAVLLDDQVPGSFDPFPHVQVSEFASWREVAAWATRLYEKQVEPSEEIGRLAARWRAMPGGPESWVTQATRFVQDEIRYLGVELGPNSHRPHAPAQVLGQRFGDCKDKALLLVVLLRQMGVEAAPALVSTTKGHGLDALHPSPFVFNHAIVRAVVDGREVWIDATRSAQGGRPATWEPPGFERALVLAPGTASLSTIPTAKWTEPQVLVEETYTVASDAQSARLDVSSTYRGDEADEMRGWVATTAHAELAKDYLDYYSHADPAIKALSEPIFHDDRDANVLRVTESYQLPEFWKEGTRDLSGWAVQERLVKPDSTQRVAPFAIEHPVDVEHRLTVRGGAWAAESRESIDLSAFSFHSKLTSVGGAVVATFRYRSLQDHVAPDEVKGYLDSVGKTRDALRFTVSRSATASQGAAVPSGALLWLGVVAGVVATGWIGLVAARAVRRQRRRSSFSR